MIQPLYLNFSRMIAGRLFKIPIYQRHYSWQKGQRGDLFDDIESTQKYPGRDHFMATVVCLDTGRKATVGSEALSLMEVVDGQQRLTTLVLLLKAIEKHLSCGSPQDEEEAGLLRRALVPSAGQYIILQTNHDSSHIFENYLREGKLPDETQIKQEADLNVCNAMIDCERFVADWATRYPVLDLLGLLKNRFYFILQLFEDARAVYTIFEVLNSRGLPVDALDKCKSTLMGALFESCDNSQVASSQLDSNHKLWGEIYRTIGIRDVPGSEILSFAATLHSHEQTSRPLSEEDSLSYFKTLCTSPDHQRNIEAVSDITKWLLRVTELLVQLYAEPRKRAIIQIRHARLLAIAIMSVDGVSEAKRQRWLREWEIVTFRIHCVFQRDSRYSVGEYVRLAQQIAQKFIPTDSVVKTLVKLGQDYPVDEAVKLLMKADCYNGWEEELRYVLRRYEEHLAQINGGVINEAAWSEIWNSSPIRSIEHIYPQGEGTYNLSAWKGKIKGGQNVVARNVHRLGNLVLLTPSLNSQAGQRGFSDKKQIYKKANLFQTSEIGKKIDWTLLQIEQRETAICAWIREAYSDVAAT